MKGGHCRKADPISTAPQAARSGRDLTTGLIPTTMLMFALPTLASSVLQSLNGSINAIWVGRFLGEDALAATTNGNITMFMLVSFVFGFGMAATIMIGQAKGRREPMQVKRVAGTAMGVMIPIGFAIALTGWVFTPQILSLLGTPGNAADLAETYLRVIFVAMPATLTFTLLMMALRGTGDALTPMYFMGLSALLDVGLNPVLILGLGPAPELGIFGSALATVFANTVALIGLVASLYWRNSALALRGPELRFLRPDKAIVTAMVTKGLPMGLQMIVISTATIAMLALINREGVATAAAFGATQQIWTYVQMPAMALGAAASAMVAQNIGADRWDRVSRITLWGLGFNILLTGTLVALVILFDRYALVLFLGPDSEGLEIGRRIALIASWGYVFFGIAMVLFGTMRANGFVIGPLLVMVISMYPVRLGVAAGLRPWLGADALWWSFPIGMMATALMAGALYLHGGWRKSSALPPSEAQQRAPQTPDAGGTTPEGRDAAPATTWQDRPAE